MNSVSKGTKDDVKLLVLKHDPNARPAAHDFAGLFHFAILVPGRRSLAHAFSALEAKNVSFDGFADHLVSESLYLHDLERNGIEIYRDRPTSDWKRDKLGRVVMDTLPLDIDNLTDELVEEDLKNDQETFPNGARIGHTRTFA